MEYAQYGRMRRGKCARQDFGYIGCSTDVLAKVDVMCSGRKTCQVKVYEAFSDLRPCTELESYLDIHYKCVKGKATNNLLLGSTTSM